MGKKQNKQKIKKKQQRLLEAGASKKKPVDPDAKNPFVEKSEKKDN